MTRLLSTLAVLWLCASAVAAHEVTRCNGLPAAVAKTRQAIRDAAAAHDYTALAKLIDRSAFTYSLDYDLGSDPIPYWKSVAGETDIPATMAAVLDMDCAVLRHGGGSTFEWPAAAEVPYSQLMEHERAALEKLYPGHVEDQYVKDGEVYHYAGWRLEIEQDGRWTSFMAGY